MSWVLVGGNSELLLGKLPEDSPLRRYAVTSLNSGERGAAIIQDLLTLARRGVAVTEVLDLNGSSGLPEEPRDGKAERRPSRGDRPGGARS
jgi:signal transduction histidine kinase